MAKFSYKVRDREDRVVIGTMEAATADEVLGKLTQKDLLPILVKELLGDDDGKPKKSFGDRVNEALSRHQNRVPYKDVVFFTRQLATMVGQGVPLSKSLDQLTRGEKLVFKRIIHQISEDIATGLTLSDAIARHPGAFNPMYVAVVRSGEIAGALDKVLDGLADYMESVEIMRGKVKTAMRYPVFIFFFVSAMMIGIMWKLVPTFEHIYEGLHAQLPVPTQILLAASHAVRDNSIPCAALIIALIILYRYLMTLVQFKIALQRNFLRVPVFGGILRKNIWATYCRTMSLLLSAGTPILKATEVASEAVDNSFFSQGLNGVYAALRKGDQLSEALDASNMFPVLVIQLVSTGESSGKVDELLSKAAEFYEREMKNVVDSLSTIIEPVLIVILGAIVGAILLSLYLPIFSIGKYIGNS